MDITTFEHLIHSNESTSLDFKREHYKLIGSTDDDLAKFIKDIISFSNTIRETTAYIILGVEEIGTTKNLIGINNAIDDNILQAKIKDKVYPRPHFTYSNFEYIDKVYGIIEIPIRRQIEPIMPIVKMKGLEIGKIYFRRGSTNDEANHREAIQINTWITNLPEIYEKSEIKEQVLDLISKLNEQKVALSVLMTEGIRIGNLTANEELISFCKNEISGYYGVYANTDASINHRKSKTFISPLKIENVTGQNGYNINHFWNDLKKEEGFFETTTLFNESLSRIEHTINDFMKNGQNGFSTLTVPAKTVPGFENSSYDNIYFYTGLDTFNHIYMRTRQVYIDYLMKII